MKIRIIYIVPSLIECGPINLLYNIVRHLDRDRFEPIIIELRKHPLIDRHNHIWFEKLGIKIDRRNYSLWYTQMNIKRIAKEISNKYGEPNTVFHAHCHYPTLITAAMKGRHTMCTIHNICDEDYTMKYNRWIARFMAYSFHKSLKKLSLSAAICKSMKDYYAADGANLTVVYNGVEVPQTVSENEKMQLRDKVGIPRNTVALLYPSGFGKRKNHKCIIEAVKLSKRTDIVVLFTGMGEETMETILRKLAGNDSRIRFLGYQSNMGMWWTIADYMISASYSEGMPSAVLEALMSGKFCILSDIPIHRQIATSVFGNDAILFNPNNPQALSTVFDLGFDCGMSELEIAAKAKMIYSSEIMTRNYEMCYDELVKDKKVL